MQGDGDDEVHIGKMRDGGKASAQERAEKTAGGEVAVVFERFRDLAVWAFIIHQGDGVGVVHGLRAAVALQDRVETVRKRVVRLDPVARERHVGGAGEAQMPLVQAQALATNEARSRQQKVARGAEGFY